MFLPFKLFCYEISVSQEEFVRVAVPSWSPPLFLALGQLLGMDQEYFSWRRKVEHEGRWWGVLMQLGCKLSPTVPTVPNSQLPRWGELRGL